MVKFLRRDSARYSRFGWGRGKKAKWRAPTGRHNKMREKIKGHPVSVSIGYGTKKKERNLIDKKAPVVIMNVKDLSKLDKSKIGVVGNVGKKNKIEIAKKAIEMKVELANLNAKSFLKKIKPKEKKE